MRLRACENLKAKSWVCLTCFYFVLRGRVGGWIFICMPWTHDSLDSCLAPAKYLGKNFTLYNKSHAGTRNARVFPLPVFAAARTLHTTATKQKGCRVDVETALEHHPFVPGTQLKNIEKHLAVKKVGQNC